MVAKFLQEFALIFLYCVSSSSAAHILFLHQYATYSHIIASWPIATALQGSGHRVSYISSTPFPEEIGTTPARANISYFVPSGLGDALGERLQQDFGLNYRLSGGYFGGNSLPLFLISPRSNHILCEALLSSTDFQAWIQNANLPENKVDLVIVDTNMDCGLGVAWALRSKVIVLQLFGFFMETLDGLGGGGGANEMVSNLLIPNSNPLSLFQKIKTTLAFAVNHFATRWYSWPKMESLFKKYLTKIGEEVPGMLEMVKNINLVLSNGHFLEEHRRPMPQNFVSVPGLHLRETHAKLNDELETLISKSAEGFIYISLGTVVNLRELPEEIKNIFFDAIRKFPAIQFLWKWNENEGRPEAKDIPQNLFLLNWFNQQDILAHSKILGFVTQGGRPSLQEALFNAVPLVTLPVLGDQDYNSLMLQDLGVSVNVEFYGLKVEHIAAAFQKLVNKEFKHKSLKVSKIYKDVPMQPVEKAVWWISYVLRHDDTSHLQPLTLEASWADKWLLDVWLTIFCVTTLSIIALFKLVKKLSSVKDEVKKTRKLKNIKSN